MPEVSFTPVDQEGSESLKLLAQVSTQLRGPVLDLAAALDLFLSAIIAAHFCSNGEEAALFQSLFLATGDITFDRKITILHDLLKLRFPDLAAKHAAVFEGLHKVRKFRNRLAHSSTDPSPPGLRLLREHGDRIRLAYYEGGRLKHHVITRAECAAIRAIGTDAALGLAEIQDVVRQAAARRVSPPPAPTAA